jgi:hypothetical protein
MFEYVIHELEALTFIPAEEWVRIDTTWGARGFIFSFDPECGDWDFHGHGSGESIAEVWAKARGHNRLGKLRKATGYTWKWNSDGEGSGWYSIEEGQELRALPLDTGAFYDSESGLWDLGCGGAKSDRFASVEGASQDLLRKLKRAKYGALCDLEEKIGVPAESWTYGDCPYTRSRKAWMLGDYVFNANRSVHTTFYEFGRFRERKSLYGGFGDTLSEVMYRYSLQRKRYEAAHGNDDTLVRSFE